MGSAAAFAANSNSIRKQNSTRRPHLPIHGDLKEFFTRHKLPETHGKSQL